MEIEEFEKAMSCYETVERLIGDGRVDQSIAQELKRVLGDR